MKYPENLSPELRGYYFYLPQEGGHVIKAIPTSLLKMAENSGKYDDYTVSIPVKYVLEKGFQVNHNRIIVDAPYDNTLGLRIDERYEEYDNPPAQDDHEQKVDTLKVGECYPYFQKNEEESMYLTSEASFLQMVILYKNPTPMETLNIREGEIKLKTVSVNGIPFLLIKFGTLPWMDGAYNPYISSNPLQPLNVGFGYPLHIIFADGWTGELKVYRIFGMDGQLSNSFKKNCDKLVASGIDNATFFNRLSEVYHAYPTSKLVELADNI